MRKALLLLLACFLSAHAATYYVSPSGVDTAPGALFAPWRTIAKVNAAAAAGTLQPGDSVLFQRGGHWRETLSVGTVYNSAPGDTLTSHPLLVSGVTFDAYGIGANPIIDAADPLTLTWTSLGGGVYRAAVPAAGMPSKIFIDGDSSITDQLIPQANAAGAYSSATTYKPFDLVTVGATDYYVHGADGSTTGVDPTNTLSSAWTTKVYNPNLNGCPNGCYAQSFSSTASGLTNVTATPGSWYSDGTNIWVHLKDGSSPSGHVVSGTYRKYGILMQSVNNVALNSFTVEHAQKGCIEFVAYSDSQGGSYVTNQNNTISMNRVWNCGDLTLDNLPLQTGVNILESAILVRADGSTTPTLLASRVTSNSVFTFDSYIGLRGGDATYQVGISVVGADGGGTANNFVIDHNFVKTINARGIVYNTDKLNNSSALLNNGGRVAYNEITNVQGALFFGFVNGGRDDDNYIHDYSGEAIQLGGNSVGPAMHDHNLLANGVIDFSNVGYNAFDCNGGSTLNTFDHNTIYNAWGSAITQENGCTGGTITNNLIVNKASLFPAYSTANNSYFYFYVSGSRNHGETAGNNYFQNSTTPNPFHVNGGTSYSLGQYAAGWSDSTSVISGDPLFVSPEQKIGQKYVSYKLKPGSPAATVALGGVPAGAYDTTANAFDLKNVGPLVSRAGRIFGSYRGKTY